MTLFEKYCRIPGTRCNAILTAIELGEDEATTRTRFGMDHDTYLVYANVLRGRVSPGTGRHNDDMEFAYRLAGRIKALGFKNIDIAERMGVSQHVVGRWLEKWRREKKKALSGKDATPGKAKK